MNDHYAIDCIMIAAVHYGVPVSDIRVIGSDCNQVDVETVTLRLRIKGIPESCLLCISDYLFGDYSGVHTLH